VSGTAVQQQSDAHRLSITDATNRTVV